MKIKGLFLVFLGFVLTVSLSGCVAPVAPSTRSDTATTDSGNDSGKTVVAKPDSAAAPTTNLTDGCIESYDAAIDYFPRKVEVTHAQGFSVEYFNNYKVITVPEPYPGAPEPIQYLLVQCGTPVPDGYANVVTIEVPVKSIVAMSTTYLPTLEALGLLDTLFGVDTGLYVYSPAVRELLDSGAVAEVGVGGEVNVEVTLDLDPDLIMAYSFGSPDYDAHPKLIEAGLPVVLNAEFADVSPLARAEWMDFIALFYNQEAAAEAFFGEVVTDYESMVALTADVSERPTVLANTPFDGTWYMPGGQSYMAQLITDAGGDFLWADDESTGTLYLDFETVLDRSIDAEYWIQVGAYDTLADFAAVDERFTEFAAYQSGEVYNSDARANENGGTDYYESGVIYPNQVLADLVKILHPDLLPDHEFVYHRQIQ